MSKKKKIKRDLIVVGGSAGALEALRELVSQLPADLPAPILLVIHSPNEFPSHLAAILGRAGPLPAIEVDHTEKLKNGTIYVAPPDRHVLINDGHVEATRGPRENRHRPAVDPLFRTAARTYGPRVIGVVLSGNLDDGSSGLMAVKLKGGLTVVQDRKEALCPEMPMRAQQYADADYELPVAEIAKLLVKATSESEAIELPEGEVAMHDPKGADKANLETDANKNKQGKPSAFACPECSGVLWELQEGELLRFRCRVGHAYTADSLGRAMSESVEEALWASMRALQEKAALMRRVADRMGEKQANEYEAEASGYDKHVETIRQILVDNQSLQEQEENAAD